MSDESFCTQAAILAGGFATRLGEIMSQTPKAALHIGGKPFLWWQMRELQRVGVDRFVILAGHLSGALRGALDAVRGSLPRGAEIVVSVEPAPAGTGGAARRAANLLDERFLLLNGDSLFNANLARLVRRRVRSAGERPATYCFGRSLTPPATERRPWAAIA